MDQLNGGNGCHIFFLKEQTSVRKLNENHHFNVDFRFFSNIIISVLIVRNGNDLYRTGTAGAILPNNMVTLGKSMIIVVETSYEGINWDNKILTLEVIFPQ